MSKEIVSVENGQVVYGHAISRLAESLSPLGAAARAVAEVSACITEMGRLKVEGKRIDADKSERLTALADRRDAVKGTLQTMRDSGDLNRIGATGLLECIAKEQRRLARLASVEEQQLSANLIEVLGNLLLAETSSGRASLTNYIDNVLNGTGTPTSAPRNGGRSTDDARRDVSRGGGARNGSSGSGSPNGGSGRGSQSDRTRHGRGRTPRRNSGGNS